MQNLERRPGSVRVVKCERGRTGMKGLGPGKEYDRRDIEGTEVDGCRIV